MMFSPLGVVDVDFHLFSQSDQFEKNGLLVVDTCGLGFLVVVVIVTGLLVSVASIVTGLLVSAVVVMTSATVVCGFGAGVVEVVVVVVVVSVLERLLKPVLKKLGNLLGKELKIELGSLKLEKLEACRVVIVGFRVDLVLFFLFLLLFFFFLDLPLANSQSASNLLDLTYLVGH